MVGRNYPRLCLEWVFQSLLEIPSSTAPSWLCYIQCLVFIADEFSVRDLCFCQDHGPEPKLFPTEVKTEKCGRTEGCMGGAFCVSFQRLTGGCLVKPGTELCF